MAIGTILNLITPDEGLQREGIHARILPETCITLSNSTVAEDAVIGTTVGTLSINAAVEGTPVWALVDSGNGAFAVNFSTGVVTVASALSTGTINIKVKVRGVKPQIVSPTFSLSVGEGGEGDDEFVLQLDGQNLQLDGQDLALGA